MAQVEKPVATMPGKKSEPATAKNSEPARNPDGLRRVVIEGISPAVDCARFPAKRTVGDQVRVEADIFTDGHDAIAASLLAHREGFEGWTEIPMHPLVNDRWTASFRVAELGRYGFKLQGWVDHFETWHRDLLKRIKAESDALVDYLIGAELIAQAADRAPGADAVLLRERASILRTSKEPAALRIHATDPLLHELVLRYPDKRFATESDHEYAIVVDPVRARFSSWYELFPRSTAQQAGLHGTFADTEKRLPYIAEMGFNVVYLPPIHPIGHTFRKGRNNSPEAEACDHGSPWAIGSEEGGHKEILSELGTAADFRHFIGLGITIFRVDNPHTKAFPFWEWVITEIKRDHPEVLFLAEAFTRPKIMYRLAKLGFRQRYTYLPWRNGKAEIIASLTELTQTQVREFFRPNQWPNTPDILTEFLPIGGRAAFNIRILLAATLGANYGIYGPAFELLENRPVRHGSEDYLNSEKYEIRQWDLDRPDSLRPLITRVNAIRNTNPALQFDWSLKFHSIDNEQLLCYSKESEDRSNLLVMIVNLDPHYTQAGFVTLPLNDLEIPQDRPYEAEDLLSGERYLWNGPRNYVELNPSIRSGHILKIHRRMKVETDFEYFL